MAHAGVILRRLWTPSDAAAVDPSLVVVYRIRLLTLFVGLLCLALLPLAFLSAWIFHSRVLAAAGLLALALSVTNSTVFQAARIWLAFRLGRWIGWNRKLVPKRENSAGFWGWTIAHVLAFLVGTVMSGGMIYIALTLPFR
jgi:hypothetical protein